MKKLLLFTVFLITSIVLRADVIKLRVFEDGSTGPYNSTIDWQPTDFLLCIYENQSSSDIKRFVVFSKVEQELDVVSSYQLVNQKDGTLFQYTCINQDGLRCSVYFTIYNDKTQKHVATLVVTYSDVQFYYKLQKNQD